MGRDGLDSRGCPENDDEKKHTAQRMMAWIPEQGSRMTAGLTGAGFPPDGLKGAGLTCV